jgi:hypothetical protein
MCRAGKTLICFAAVLIWTAGAGYGQSLGDAARQQRQKQQAKKDQSAPKLITNEDLPEHTQDASNSGPADQRNGSEHHRSSSESAEQWKAQIEAQKQSVAALQSQMERLNSSIHFVEANRYRNGVQYNQRQEQKQEQVQRMQEQLDLQKKQLDDMQEAARKDGFGNAVYDP